MSTPVSFFQISHIGGKTEVIPALQLERIVQNGKTCTVTYYTTGNATTFPNTKVTVGCKSVEPYSKRSNTSKNACIIS